MLVLSWQNKFWSEVLLLFDNTIDNIAKALQVRVFCGEQVEVDGRAANNV